MILLKQTLLRNFHVALSFLKSYPVFFGQWLIEHKQCSYLDNQVLIKFDSLKEYCDFGVFLFFDLDFN